MMHRTAMDLAMLRVERDSLEDDIREIEREGRRSEREFGTKRPHAPLATADRSKNELRPNTFDTVVGQAHTKSLLKRMVDNCKARGRRMDHVLLVGPSGTGKTTLAHVIAHELGAEVYQVEAPISGETLLELREAMQPGDILFVDEIHQQAIQERRGRSSSTQPEVLFSIMEDFTIPTETGVLPFPEITMMGATTDEGMLPDAFVNRFPIRPRLERYTVEDMTAIAKANARALHIGISDEAAAMFAGASRGVPREVNNYVKNAAMLTAGVVKRELAFEVLHDLNGVTLDGLTRDMQSMLTFLYTRAMHVREQDGRILYQASVSTIATAIGKSRDQKAIALRVEPYLIELGLVQVTHGGRRLTDEGVRRARQLLKGD